jgi:periplasmic protein TonB
VTIRLAWSRISSFVLHTRNTFGAVLVALLAELLVLVGAALWLTHHLSAPPVTPPLGPIQLDLTKLPTPEPAQTAPPQPTVAEPPPPAEQPTEQPPVTEQSTQAQPVPLPETPSDEAPNEADSPSPSVTETEPMPLPDLSLLPHDQSAHAGPYQPAPSSANGQTSPLSEFVQQLNQALRSAVRYPEQVSGAKLSRRVYVRVHYRDGKVWGAVIVQSSGVATLDQAVLDGVIHAAWPAPPPSLEGREIVVPIMGEFW